MVSLKRIVELLEMVQSPEVHVLNKWCNCFKLFYFMKWS